MWSKHFIDWSQTLYPFVYRVAQQTLVGRNDDSRFQADIPELAREARRLTFEQARRHRPITDYFPDFAAFRFWIAAVVAQHTLRLYLLHPSTAVAALSRLSVLERRLLRLVYVDRLAPSEVARLSGIPADRVAATARAALAALEVA